MNGFNQVTLCGNVTRQPELRYTPKGTAVAGFGIALNKKWKDDAGQTHEKCTFIDVTAWSGAAETLAQYVQKGDPLLLSGELDLETWDDKQTGEKRSKLKVILRSFTFLPNGRQGAGAAPAATPVRSGGERKAAAAQAPEPPDDEDSQIPF